MKTVSENYAPVSERLRQGVETRSGEETAQLAAAWAAELPAGVWIALHGDLGVGKTTFVAGLAHGLGVTEPITSPTFSILNIYHGTRQLLHIDAYRLEGSAEAADLLLEDWIRPPFCVAVEWPDVLGDLLPADALHVELAITAPGRHRIRLRG